MKVSLPGEQWAALRDPETVTEGERRPLVRLQRRTLLKAAPHLAELGDVSPAKVMEKLAPLLSAEDFDALEEIDDLVIEVLVASWSYDFEPDRVGATKLPGKARNALLNECRPLLSVLLGDTSDEDVLNPDSPTVAANGSGKP